MRVLLRQGGARKKEQKKHWEPGIYSSEASFHVLDRSSLGVCTGMRPILWIPCGRLRLRNLPRALLPAIQKRLQMFILRAKVKVQDVSDQQAILGLAGDRAAAALQTWFPELPLPQLPATFGLDVAGVVAEVGDLVQNFVTGDRVYSNLGLAKGLSKGGADQIYLVSSFPF